MPPVNVPLYTPYNTRLEGYVVFLQTFSLSASICTDHSDKARRREYVKCSKIPPRPRSPPLRPYGCAGGEEEVVDYGTGSGVLATAAVLLGAKHATAVDVDFEILAHARQNFLVSCCFFASRFRVLP